MTNSLILPLVGIEVLIFKHAWKLSKLLTIYVSKLT